MIAHKESDEEKSGIKLFSFDRDSDRRVVIFQIAGIRACTKIYPFAEETMAQVSIMLFVGESLNDRCFNFTAHFARWSYRCSFVYLRTDLNKRIFAYKSRSNDR